MKRATLLALVVLMLSHSSFAQSTKPVSKFWGIDQYNIGVVSGNVIKVYWKEMYGGWSHAPNNTFTIPPNCKNVFMHQDEICVYSKDNKVKFYKNLAPSKWVVSKKNNGQPKTFQLNQTYDRVFSMFSGGFGFVKNNIMDYYTDEGVLKPEYQFHAPEQATDFFAVTPSAIAVATSNGLDRYTIGTDGQWHRDEKSHLDYPEGKTDVISCGDDFVGFVKGSSIDIYYYGENLSPIRVTTFTASK
jgi:hypothetical protein